MVTPSEKLNITNCRPYFGTSCSEDNGVADTGRKLIVEETVFDSGKSRISLPRESPNFFKAPDLYEYIAINLNDFRSQSQPQSHAIVCPGIKEQEYWRHFESQEEVNKARKGMGGQSEGNKTSDRQKDQVYPSLERQSSTQNNTKSTKANPTSARLLMKVTTNQVPRVKAVNGASDVVFHKKNQPSKELSEKEDVLGQVSQTKGNEKIEKDDSGLGSEVQSRSVGARDM